MADILKDKRFKKALESALEDSFEGKNLGTTHERALTVYLPYVAEKLNEANTYLKMFKSNNIISNDATGQRRDFTYFADAFTVEKRRYLVAVLSVYLITFARQYHLSLGRDQDTPPTNTEIDTMWAVAPAGHRGSLAVQTIIRSTQNFLDYVKSISDNVHDDWFAIQAVFFPGQEIQKLLDIKFTSSDSHKKNKHVVFLTFETKPPAIVGRSIQRKLKNVIRTTSQKKVVYKPSNLALDWLMLANTALVRQRLNAANLAAFVNDLPQAPATSLFEVLATRAGTHNWNANNPHRRVTFPTYLILPRKSTGGNDNDTINNSYAYIQMLTYNPRPKKLSAGSTSAGFRKELGWGKYAGTLSRGFSVDLNSMAPADWDWIVHSNAPDAIRDYWALFGWVSVIGMILGMGDVHQENIIVHRKMPHLIDVELSFRGWTATVDDTQIGNLLNNATPAENMSTLMCAVNGTQLQYTTNMAANPFVKAGITAALDLLTQDANWRGDLQTWLNDNALDNVLCRYTTRPTKNYYDILQAFFTRCHEPNPANAGEKEALIANYKLVDTQGFYKGVPYDIPSSNNQNNYPLCAADHDPTDLLNGDIPIYYRKLSSIDILNARGQAVAVAAPAAAWTLDPMTYGGPRSIPGTRYFDFQPSKFLFEFNFPNAGLDDTSNFPRPNGKVGTLQAVLDAFQTAGHALNNPTGRTLVQGSRWDLAINAGPTYELTLVQLVSLADAGGTALLADEPVGPPVLFLDTSQPPEMLNMPTLRQLLLNRVPLAQFAIPIHPQKVKRDGFAFTATGYKCGVIDGANARFTLEVKYRVRVDRTAPLNQVQQNLFVFDYPASGLDDDANPQLLANDVTTAFQNGGHQLTNAARGTTELTPVQQQRWRIIDGNHIYHLIRSPQNAVTVRVFEVASGLDSARHFLTMLVNDANFRGRIRADAHRFYDVQCQAIETSQSFYSFSVGHPTTYGGF